MRDAVLILKNDTIFQGKALGKRGIVAGEVCFTTSITGYQHTITDPSFADQIITFTFPHIGNVGVNNKDFERSKIFAKGIIVREVPNLNPAHPASYTHMQKWLEDNEIVGISGIDTRLLTKHLRSEGSVNGVICSLEGVDILEIKQHLSRSQTMKGKELSKVVTGIGVSKGNNIGQIVIVDFGLKAGIAQQLENVIVVPATDNFAEGALSYNPAGIILSNGPGDPEATARYATPEIKKLFKANVVIFGICLGHQLLGIALGCNTIKMTVGHRGSNHPVYNMRTKKVEITSQNHGFVLASSEIPSNVEVTHESLFDGSIEGIKVKDKPIFSVQYHPEGSPGPHDSHYLFDIFRDEIAVKNK